MKTIRIEVSSDQEAIELCNLNGYIYNGIDYDEDGTFLNAIDPEEYGDEKVNPVDSDLIYVIFTVLDNNTKLYLSNKTILGRNITFKLGEAKRFEKEEAETKAHFMTMRSKNGHIWRFHKI